MCEASRTCRTHRKRYAAVRGVEEDGEEDFYSSFGLPDPSFFLMEQRYLVCIY